MGILDSLTRNPGLLALTALGIGLFVFRDRISQFFSDITGGAAGTASIAKTGGILARNLQSNLTATPLPEDPLFGEQGFFTTLGATLNNLIKNFKLPELPSFDIPRVITEPGVTAGDFTDVGMAAARARQDQQPLVPLEGAPEFIGPVQPFQLPDLTFEAAVPIDPISQLNIGQEQPLTEAPLGALSLSAIIDKFMVTASQAANIKFISQQGGDPFATPENIFGENPPAVSDPQFLGLTPEQIALKLTGGNISNF